MPQPIKDFLVVFDEFGQIESTKDITNSNTPARKRRIAVKATTAGKAEKIAAVLYTYSE